MPRYVYWLLHVDVRACMFACVCVLMTSVAVIHKSTKTLHTNHVTFDLSYFAIDCSRSEYKQLTNQCFLFSFTYRSPLVSEVPTRHIYNKLKELI